MAEFARRWQNGTIEDLNKCMLALLGTMITPGLINLGGGTPAKEALPLKEIRDIADDVFTIEKRGVEAFSYGSATGAQDFKEAIVKYLLAPKGLKDTTENIIVVAGSTEVMNLVSQTFLNPGDVVLVEDPTYLQSTIIFQLFGAKVVGIAMDENGMKMDEAEEKIKQYKPKLVYTIPTFQNPTGVTMSVKRRKRLAQLAGEYDFMVLEDDPYRDIRYSGEALPPIKAFDTTNHVILAGSFSKIFSPGSRLGYAVATKEIIAKMADGQMCTNVHSPMESQVLAAEFFNRGYFPEHLKRVCTLYKERRDAMLHAIDAYFPKGCTHTNPDGGMFVWINLPKNIDAQALLKEAVAQTHVAYAAGNMFFVDPRQGKNTMRLCFTSLTPDKITLAVKKLGEFLCYNI